MDKDAVRQNVRKALANIKGQERKEIERAFLDTLIDQPEWRESKSLALTMAMGDEWATRPIIEKAWDQDKTVSIPKSLHKTRELHYYKITNFQQISEGYYGIEEPDPDQTIRTYKEDIDLVLVPGVAFVKSGYRIGHGGGYYDRFLSDYQGNTVSLVHPVQLIEEMLVERFDVPVQKLITTDEVIQTEDYR